jgi:hypothetical protein
MTTEVQVAPTASWFYGFGNCDECGIYHHLYVSNDVRDQTLCAGCLINIAAMFLKDRYEYPEVLHYTGDFKEALYDYRTRVPEIQPDNHKFCGACLRPFSDSETPVWGKLWNGVEGLFHDVCCEINCATCQVYTPRWSWHFPLTMLNREYYDYLSPYKGDSFPTNPNILEGTRYCNEHLQVELDTLSAYFQCERCNEYHDMDRSDYFTWHSDTYCEECRDECFRTCDYCDEWYDIDSDHDCGEDQSGIIHSYSYKPYYTFFGTGSYHLGFELEVELQDGDRTLNYGAEKLLEVIGHRAYYKYDGSVEDGFEIVTHPHTLEEYQTRFPWDFVPLARRMGYRSWNADASCGFHVHVGRVAFGPGKNPRESDKTYLERTIIVRQRHEIRFTKLFYDNQRQVERIAGRQANMYAQFGDKNRIYHKIKRGWSTDGRYSVINTENRDTIEVRIFKGSLNQARLLANLELVHCAVEYTRDLKVTGTNKALSWVKFTGYVGQNMEKYPHLFALMEKTFNNEPLYDNRTVEEGVEA